jgi:hypothetical protein
MLRSQRTSLAATQNLNVAPVTQHHYFKVFFDAWLPASIHTMSPRQAPLSLLSDLGVPRNSRFKFYWPLVTQVDLLTECSFNMWQQQSASGKRAACLPEWFVLHCRLTPPRPYCLALDTLLPKCLKPSHYSILNFNRNWCQLRWKTYFKHEFEFTPSF